MPRRLFLLWVNLTVLALNGVQKTLDFQNVSACMNFDFVTHICQSWKPEFA